MTPFQLSCDVGSQETLTDVDETTLMLTCSTAPAEGAMRSEDNHKLYVLIAKPATNNSHQPLASAVL